MNERVSDLMLERYLADDLSAEQRARVEAAVKDSPTVQARLVELESLRDSFLAVDPPEAFAHRLAVRLEHEAPAKRPWWKIMLGPSLAVAIGGAAALFFAVKTEDEAPALESTLVLDEALPEREEAEAPTPSADAMREVPVPADEAPVKRRARAEGVDYRSESRANRPEGPERSVRRSKRKKTIRGGGASGGAPAKQADEAAEPSARKGSGALGRRDRLADGEAEATVEDDFDDAAFGYANEEALNLAAPPAKASPAPESAPERSAEIAAPAAPEEKAAPRASERQREAQTPRTQSVAQPAGPPPRTTAGDAEAAEAIRVSMVGSPKVDRIGESVKLRIEGRGFFAVLVRYRDSAGARRGRVGKLVSFSGSKAIGVRVEGTSQEILVLTSEAAFDPSRYRAWTRSKEIEKPVPRVRRRTFRAPTVSTRKEADDAAASEAKQ